MELVSYNWVDKHTQGNDMEINTYFPCGIWGNGYTWFIPQNDMHTKPFWYADADKSYWMLSPPMIGKYRSSFAVSTSIAVVAHTVTHIEPEQCIVDFCQH